MVCTVCGAELADGAKFCPSCGTPVAKPAEEAAEAVNRAFENPVPENPVPAEAAPADAYPANAAPYDAAPAAESPVYTEPAYTPPVYTEPVYTDPSAGGPIPPPADPGPIPPAGGPEPVKKKKWLIPAIIAAAVIVVVALIIAIPRLLSNAGKPEDQYHKAELKGLKNVSESLSNYYGNLLSFADKADDLGVTGSAELSADEELYDLIGGGMDLSWLKTVSVDYELNRKDDLAGGALTLKLNKDKLTTVNLLLDQAEQMIYLQAPDVSKNYLGADLENMGGSLMYSLRRYLPSSLYWTLASLLSDTDSETEEQITAVMEALPTQEQVKKLLDKYLEIAINSIEDVERDKDTLEAGEVSVNCTTLTVTINQKSATKIVENVLTELKKDKDVEGYIKAIAKAVEEDPEDAYEAFAEGLEDTLEDLEDSLKNSDSSAAKQKIVMTVYLDGKGNIIGRDVKTNFDSNIKFHYATPAKGGKLGIDISLKSDSQTLFSLTGEGKVSGSTVSLEAALKVRGAKLLDITVEKLDGSKLKQGYFKGVVTLKPGTDLLSQVFKLSSSEEKIAKKMTLTLDVDTSKGSSNLKLILNYDESPLVSLALSGKSSSAKKISGVKDYLESDEWVEELNEKDLKAFLKNLKKTDIPSEYLEELEDYIDRYF